jgi:CheY-like chemotaxis protein
MRTDARIDEPLKVLIVEDEVLLAIDLESHLEALGQEIVGLAGDATQALALADVEHPDLALVDINLRDGRTGLVISSKLGAGHDTTVVLVTGSPEQIPADYAGAIGALTKPWRPEALEQLVMFVRALRVPGSNASLPAPPASMRLAPHLQSDLAPRR